VGRGIRLNAGRGNHHFLDEVGPDVDFPGVWTVRGQGSVLCVMCGTRDDEQPANVQSSRHERDRQTWGGSGSDQRHEVNPMFHSAFGCSSARSAVLLMPLTSNGILSDT